jgi:DNA-binding response OmpR family regulator
MKVLICEDEEIMLTAIEFRLQKAGFGILRAKNGDQAKTVLKEQDVGLIVLDMVMPDTDCYEVIHHIREELKHEAPIILLAPIEKKDEEVLEAFQMGINDFVVKPFKPTELILRIKRIFQDRGIEIVKEKIT